MMRRTILVAVMAVLGASQAMAQWDLSSVTTVASTWADNVDYSNTDKRDPDGDALTSIRVRGLAEYQGPRWTLAGFYEPTASLHRDRTDLNRVSHIGQIRSTWGLSPTTELRLSDQYVYSPDQGASSENVNVPVLITDFTDRRSNQVRADASTRLSALSTLTYGVSHGFQLFSDPDLTDTARLGANMLWNRSLSQRVGIEVNARTYFDRYERRRNDDPNTVVNEAGTARDTSRGYTVTGGGNLNAGARFSARGRLGFDLIIPDRRDLSNRRGFHADVSGQWIATYINANVGYTQALTTGSGIFAVSRTQSVYMNLRAVFGDHVTGLLYANQSFSKNAANPEAGTVDTFSGGASVEVLFSRALSGRVQVSANEQSAGGQRTNNIDFNRISVGLVARID